jgi:hypothetical protein
LVLLSASAVLAGVVACGIDESGLQDDGGGPDVLAPDVVGNDVTPPPSDGGVDVLQDVQLPPSCANADLSCIGYDAGLPSGWSPYVAEMDGGACPPGDFTSSAWVTNTRLHSGSCACGCNKTADWACPTSVDVQIAHSNCNANAATVTVGACTQAGNNADHIQFVSDASVATGAACTPTTGSPTVDSDPVNLCAAGCDAGFCGQAAGTRCIAADGVQSCPGTGFTQYLIGASGDPSCDTSTCTCNVGTAPNCTASMTPYYGYWNSGWQFNGTCSTSGGFKAGTPYGLDGTCQDNGPGFDSYEVSWSSLGTTSCNPDQANAPGDAGLASPKTICCK